jgi:hypothetical protein
MKGKLVNTKSVLLCSRCKILRCVTASCMADTGLPLLLCQLQRRPMSVDFFQYVQILRQRGEDIGPHCKGVTSNEMSSIWADQ